MQLLYHSALIYLSLLSSTTASADPDSDEKPSTHQPCTIRSPTSGAFFDLNPLHIEDPSTSKVKHPRLHSWNQTLGYDYGRNFTVNFCGGVIEDLKELGGVEGVEEGMWRNVSAFYMEGGKVVSLGMQNDEPVFRGRKLVMNYTNGSPCGSETSKRRATDLLNEREIIDPDQDDDDDDDDEDLDGDDEDEDDGDDKKSSKKKASGGRRKSSIISFLCDREPLAPLLTLSFVAASEDECTYFFEARSSAACGGIEKATQTLSPGGVFGVIAIIAIAVYVVGGCVYSRMVLQQRGWRQLPNYQLWSGIFGFFRDLVVILTSSCARFLPSRRGYSRVNSGMGGSGTGRGRGRGDSDAENRLIDELNEEWED